ncbi:MAG: hypothetical protein HRU03_02120 [Nanoarchaeales archaeon]|nr:hypothetical protein [Nanoarchaeales archaeon]
MRDIGYLFPKKIELFPITIVTFVLSLLFSILIIKLSSIQNDLIGIFIPIFIFLNLLFHTKLIFMKYTGLRYGIELTFALTYFNYYGVRKFETLSNKFPDLTKQGLSTIIISILIYIITLGFLIVPSIWKINFKKIPHLYIGSGEHHELGFALTPLFEVTYFRIAKTYITGFFFYFIFAQLIEIFFKQAELYPWLQAITFYIAFFTLIPMPGFEGYELYLRNKFGYMMLIPILFTGMLSIIVFESVFFTVLVVFLVFGYIYFDNLWKKMQHGAH